jgi:hypothetical protein
MTAGGVAAVGLNERLFELRAGLRSSPNVIGPLKPDLGYDEEKSRLGPPVIIEGESRWGSGQ